jgi:hypothetical protein
MPKIRITEDQLQRLIEQTDNSAVNHLKSLGFVGIDASKGDGKFGVYHYAALATARMLMRDVFNSLTTAGRNYCYRVGMFGTSGQLKYKIDNYGDYGEMRSDFEPRVPGSPTGVQHDVWNTFFLYDFYFEYGKLLNAGEKAFPNGAYEWFVNWFGTDNVNQIKTKMTTILKKEPPFCHGGGATAKLSFSNPNYGAEAGISKETGHMILDIISIAALVLPPPIGIGISVAADSINTVWYMAEGDYLGAGLSAVGILPGIPSAVKGLRVSSKTEKAFEGYLEAVSKSSNKGEKALPTNTMQKYYDDAVEGLSKTEKAEFDSVWKHVQKNQSKWSNINPEKAEQVLGNINDFMKNGSNN